MFEKKDTPEWSQEASWLEMPAEDGPYRLKALGLTHPLRTVDCGGCGTLGCTCSAREDESSEGNLRRALGTLPHQWQAGD